MSQSIPSDGDLTGGAIEEAPRLNVSSVEGETVKGLEVSGTEFKLSEVLKGDAPAFNSLSGGGEPTVFDFLNFTVAEMPGGTELKVAFGIQPKSAAFKGVFGAKLKELFGAEVDDISDVSDKYPFIIQVTDGSVIGYAWEIFKTLDHQIEEMKGDSNV